MFILVLLSYVLAHDNVASSAPVIVGKYASFDACKNAASHAAWVNAHGADNSRFGFVCVQASASMPGMQPGGMQAVIPGGH
jgi:hypothetical protein